MTKSKQVVWSERARKDLVSIKKFFDERNGNTNYSNKLLRQIRDETLLLKDYPSASIATEYKEFRGLIVSNYIVFHVHRPQGIIIVGVWDTRRNPKHLTKFLKRKS
jgi:plasmid stabilization system protein ParE